MRLREDVQAYHLEKVREALVIEPHASNHQVREMLANLKVPIIIGDKYCSKLMHKVRMERIHRFRKPDILPLIASIEDTTNMVTRQMWAILTNPNNDPKSRVSAGKIIIDSQHKLLEQKMNAGMFDRKLGTLEINNTGQVEHVHRLPPEEKALIMRALENYGIIKRPKYTVVTPEPPRAITAG